MPHARCSPRLRLCSCLVFLPLFLAPSPVSSSLAVAPRCSAALGALRKDEDCVRMLRDGASCGDGWWFSWFSARLQFAHQKRYKSHLSSTKPGTQSGAESDSCHCGTRTPHPTPSHYIPSHPVSSHPISVTLKRELAPQELVSLPVYPTLLKQWFYWARPGFLHLPTPCPDPSASLDEALVRRELKWLGNAFNKP